MLAYEKLNLSSRSRRFFPTSRPLPPLAGAVLRLSLAGKLDGRRPDPASPPRPRLSPPTPPRPISDPGQAVRAAREKAKALKVPPPPLFSGKAHFSSDGDGARISFPGLTF
jgi:hypothetical protein